MTFRTLNADEIDVRIAKIGPKAVTLLLYKDARVDMNILDETVGPMNWQKRYTRDNANCIVSLWDAGKEEWISKEDTGVESYTEKEKGLASDSFKRACFNWGIGRELYTAPRIIVMKENFNVTSDGKCYDSFTVTKIGYDERRNINDLEIVNDNTRKIIFSMKNIPKAEKSTPAEGWGNTKIEPKHAYIFQKKCEEAGIAPSQMAAKYDVKQVMDMTMGQFNAMMKELTKLCEAQSKG